MQSNIACPNSNVTRKITDNKGSSCDNRVKCEDENITMKNHACGEGGRE